ncbi:MAG: germination protein YpeB [Ruminiclostridium sp.]|nr:germination protein YpeB [Ruminiclostridium sp.]
MANVTMSRRALARILTFSLAIILVLAVFAVSSARRAAKAERAVENSYMHAVEELSLGLDNIKNNLQKGMYTNSISMLSDLSEKLCSDASNAKNSLSRLPVDELDLTDAYKFLSQVGNYSKSLSEKCAEGGSLTADEKKNIAALYAYATQLSGNMWEIEQKIENGRITLADVEYSASRLEADDPVSVTNGFTDFSVSDTSFPTLIYDGPYSDHIMEKKPLMLENKTAIDANEALRLAKRLSDSGELKLLTQEDGKMPSYVFADDNHTIAVTKAGGMYSYMLSSRRIGKQTITAKEAINRAKDYLSELGVRGLTDSYYEIRNGICVVNLAAEQNGVTMYTDLIKVGVALDNGDVLSFDMRGYLTNHTIRELPQPKISAKLAETLISGSLTPISTKLCVIPSSGMNEVFCYEVRCTGEQGENILVYLNAETGREEQILILKIGRGGVLTV